MFLRRKVLIPLLAIVLAYSVTTQARAKEAKSEPYGIVATVELKAMLDGQTTPILVIDARNPEEYEDVHIPGAINIPQKKFEEYNHLLPKDKTTRLVFYCNGVK